MRSKLGLLTKMSLKKKIGSKWFLVVNIILAAVIIGLININQIIAFFGGDFNQELNIIVIDETNEASQIFEQDLKNTKNMLDTDFKYNIELSNKSLKEEKKNLKDENKVLIVFETDENEYIKAKVISEKQIDTLDYQTLIQALTTTKAKYALSKSTIDVVELNKISQPINIERIILDETKKTEEESMSIIMGTVFPTVILPFFMLTIFLVQMLGAEINEEKTTRSMEIIISNVSAKTHFFSKVIAANVFVISQGFLLLLYGGIGIFIRNLAGGSTGGITDQVGQVWDTLVSSSFADKLVYVIPLTLILMLLSFLAYSLVAGILASMTVNMEDYQQIQAPIVLISVVGYYLAIMAGMFDGSLFIRILSYVPFLSCLVSPALLILGQITIWDVLISIILLVLFNYVAIKYGLQIYKVGILNYSNEKVWNRLFKAIKTKEI